MTKERVIEIFKKALEGTYTIKTVIYEGRKEIEATYKDYPNQFLTFERAPIEAALAYLEGQNDI